MSKKRGEGRHAGEGVTVVVRPQRTVTGPFNEV
jgi:hypothetical protein